MTVDVKRLLDVCDALKGMTLPVVCWEIINEIPELVAELERSQIERTAYKTALFVSSSDREKAQEAELEQRNLELKQLCEEIDELEAAVTTETERCAALICDRCRMGVALDTQAGFVAHRCENDALLECDASAIRATPKDPHG